MRPDGKAAPLEDAPVEVGGVRCHLSRTGFGGELGYELFCSPQDAESLWSVVVERCAATPFGVEAVEILRIEAGLMILDYDYAPHQRTPYDLSMDRLVALDVRVDDRLAASLSSRPFLLGHQLQIDNHQFTYTY